MARIPGVDADLLMPAITTESGAQADATTTFDTYVARMIDDDAFPYDRDALEALRNTRATAGAPVQGDTRPILGIVASTAKHLVEAGLSFKEMIERFTELGCRCVVLPPRGDLLLPEGSARARSIDAMIAMLDGFIGPGGEDVDPAQYGEANTYSINPNGKRDGYEAELVKGARRAPVMMLGICRSHQLWQTTEEGSLVQDLAKEGHISHTHEQQELAIPFDQPLVYAGDAKHGAIDHVVETASTGDLARILGGPRHLRTNSIHHQAVRNPGTGFRVVAHVHDSETGKDIIEATEASNALTFQWHPELASARSEANARILQAVKRRADLCKLVREARESGKPTSSSALASRMLAADTPLFLPSDFVWSRRGLQQQLALLEG